MELLATPLEAFIEGEFNADVPLLVGSVQDEAATFIWSNKQPAHLPEFLLKCVRHLLQHTVSLASLMGCDDG